MIRAIVKLFLVFLFIIPLLFSACTSPRLGDYLADMFVGNGVILEEDDFLEPVEDPYLAYAKILSLIP